MDRASDQHSTYWMRYAQLLVDTGLVERSVVAMLPTYHAKHHADRYARGEGGGARRGMYVDGCRAFGLARSTRGNAPRCLTLPPAACCWHRPRCRVHGCLRSALGCSNIMNIDGLSRLADSIPNMHGTIANPAQFADFKAYLESNYKGPGREKLLVKSFFLFVASRWGLWGRWGRETEGRRALLRDARSAVEARSGVSFPCPQGGWESKHPSRQAPPAALSAGSLTASCS